MTVLPMVDRELRTSARQSFTYNLRVLGLLALLLAGVVFGLNYGFQQDLGPKLFGALHSTLFCAIWFFVPFLAVDSISRERREGTLGLLFMTPLRAPDIVVAKGLAHGLRALTLWLAVLPVLTLPFIMGGIGWSEAGLSILINFSAICLALAAGLAASALSRVWTRVLVYAGGLSLLFGLVFVVLNMLLVLTRLRRLAFASPWNPERLVSESFFLATDWDGYWPGNLGGIARQCFEATAAATFISLLLLLLTFLFTARRVNRVWREEPPSVRIQWLEKKFCKPVFFRSLYRRWMCWKLERNPIGWLEQRTWTGRLVTWSWLGVVSILYCIILGNPYFLRDYGGQNQVIAWLLAGSLALSAAGSFRRERETGVLELLLVSPLPENEIVWGRLRGLWGQFLPASVILVGIWFYFSVMLQLASYSDDRGEAGAIFFYAGAFLCVPVIGLYFSLRNRHFITAFLATLAVAIFLPSFVAAAVSWLFWFLFLGEADPNPSAWLPSHPFIPGIHAAFWQLVLAILFWGALVRRLKRRSFPFSKP
jgi:ABC-type transport system involved in multi-copper enzyme maturation permease subunit